jgi:GNAT superfamily N-acetyltransferase
MSTGVREARAADVPAVVRLVHELAAYEREPESCTLTEPDLHAALFGPAPALFCHVAQVDDEVVGCALWFVNFSTWTGTHGIHLEDLYVSPAHRGARLGRALLARLAQLCVERGYARLEWAVLDWNTPAIGFYQALGARELTDWTVFRLSDEPLAALTGLTRAPGPSSPAGPSTTAGSAR